MTDFDSLIEAERAMSGALKRMDTEAHAYALASQVTELAGERRKMAFSRLVTPHLDADLGVGEAEHRARADDRYLAELRTISKQTAAAEETIARYKLAQHQYEAARSILSVRRAQIGLT
jgi:hypothetical protein